MRSECAKLFTFGQYDAYEWGACGTWKILVFNISACYITHVLLPQTV